MSGGLRHHNDEENGPSHAVGHKSSKNEDGYWHRGDHCLCANGKRVPKTTKARSPSPLDMTGAVRDVVIINNYLLFSALGRKRKNFIALTSGPGYPQFWANFTY